MSGDVFATSEFESLNANKWNPLLCTLCNERYEDPRHLNCHHSFCAKCLCGRVKDQRLLCPLCGTSTVVKENSSLPSPDQLLRFLVESSSEEKAQCANCDKESSQMFFCNTCCQPLCSPCREETHKAKMFTKHDIVGLTKRTRDVVKECSIHREPFILFSTEKKTMLCINCFRDMKNESRSHCMDLETAYSQSCKKVDNGMQAIRDLQNSVRDALILLRVLLQEIKTNAEKEKAAIIFLYDLIQEKITEKKEALLQQAEDQYVQKEELFRDQLQTLSTLLPTLHAHLVTCAAVCSSANKFEFLSLGYVLLARLKSVIQVRHPLHPTQGSQINTDHKNQFAKCLEPVLFPLRTTTSATTPPTLSLTCTNNMANARLDRFELPRSAAKTKSEVAVPGQIGYTLARSGGRRYNGHNGNRVKFIDAKGVFADHCKDFETIHRELMQNVEKKKNDVQELQRDLTLRRCLSKGAVFPDMISSIEKLESNLSGHHSILEQKHPILEKHWEESLQRIANEQEVFQAQLNDVFRLEQETKQLKTILQQLSSFIRSITAVSERLAPRLGESCKDADHETQMQSLLDHINTMQPDSQQRVDAIRTAQEERISTANWANPLDEELIKTKGLLKAPSERSNIKRSSRELKEDLIMSEEQDLCEQTETLESKLSDEQTTPKLTGDTGETQESECPSGDCSEIVSEESKIIDSDNTSEHTEEGEIADQNQDSVVHVQKSLETIEIDESEDQHTCMMIASVDSTDSDIGDIVVNDADIETDTVVVTDIIANESDSCNVVPANSSQSIDHKLYSADNSDEEVVDMKVEEAVTIALEKCDTDNLCCVGKEKDRSMDSGIDEISTEKVELKKDCVSIHVNDKVGKFSPKTKIGRKKKKKN